MDMDKMLQVLVPKEVPVTIDGKVYTVRKMGLKQSIQLASFAAELQDEARSQILKAAEAGQNDLIAIVSNLAEGQVGRLVGIVVNAQQPDDLARFTAMGLDDLSELALAIVEVNDFSRIVANFQKAAAHKNAAALMSLGQNPPQTSSHS